jgi:hypothetical protein
MINSPFYRLALQRDELSNTGNVSLLTRQLHTVMHAL